MQVKCGTDLVQVQRIKKAAEKIGRPFLCRIWTDAEQEACLADGDFARNGLLTPMAAASLAARFAAKEAVAKALGTGIGPAGVHWTDIEVSKAASGSPPKLRLTGGALDRYHQLDGQSISISMSHEGGLALACCVLLLADGEQDEQT